MQPYLAAPGRARGCLARRSAAAAAPALPARRARAARAAAAPGGAGPSGPRGGKQQDLLLASCPVPQEQQPMFQLLALQVRTAATAHGARRAWQRPARPPALAAPAPPPTHHPQHLASAGGRQLPRRARAAAAVRRPARENLWRLLPAGGAAGVGLHL
jgi:hypothetical protein